jgi:hypothetical protein
MPLKIWAPNYATETNGKIAIRLITKIISQLNFNKIFIIFELLQINIVFKPHITLKYMMKKFIIHGSQI